MTTLREIITGSLRLIRVVGANETPTDEDMQISLESLQGMLDSMQTDLLNIYTINPYRFLFTAGAEKYTLGPAIDSEGIPTGANWVIERPMRVEKAVLLQNADVIPAVPPAPVLTAPTTTDISLTGATIGATTDVGAGTLYVAVTTGPTAPSASAIISGVGFAAAANQSVTSPGAKVASVTGLTPATTYYHYHVQAGAPGGNSNVLSSAPFITSLPPPTDPLWADVRLLLAGDSPTFTDLSTSARVPLQTNFITTTPVAGSLVGGSMGFSGVGNPSLLYTPSVDFSTQGPWTLDFRIMLTSSAPTTYYFMATGGGRYVSVEGQTILVVGWANAGAVLELNQWYWFRFVCDANNFRTALLDGVPVSAPVLDQNANSNPLPFNVFQIPGNELQGFKNGFIEQVRFTRAARSILPQPTQTEPWPTS